MKYFWTFFWTFLLVQMLTYVATSMIGAEFDYKIAAIISVPTTILIYLVPFILPNDPAGHKEAH